MIHFLKPFSASTWFSYDRDVLIIGLEIYIDASLRQAKEGCEEWFEDIRGQASYLDGKLGNENEISRFSSFFQHSGYIKGDLEENMDRMKGLDKKFRLGTRQITLEN